MKRIAFALSLALSAGLGITSVAAGPAAAAEPDPPRPHVFSVPADLDVTAPGIDLDLLREANRQAREEAQQDAQLDREGAPAPEATKNDRLRAAGTPSAKPSPTPSPTPTSRPCAALASAPVLDGQPILVSLPPAAPFRVGSLNRSYWQNPPVKDPTWRLFFWSMRWAGPLVRRAQQDGQPQAVEAVLAQVARFYVDNPDTGRAVLGWDEGGSLRRLESLNCLYRMTGDKRLPGLMAQEVGVLFGPRYYGPPYHPVHNHGLMANLRIVEAGALLNRPEW